MKIRAGKTRSLLAGVMVLLVMGVGLVLLSGFGGFVGFFGYGRFVGVFMILWVVFGLTGAGVSFYNAFSRAGLPLYEVELCETTQNLICPDCAKPVNAGASFCEQCGAPIRVT